MESMEKWHCFYVFVCVRHFSIKIQNNTDDLWDIENEIHRQLKTPPLAPVPFVDGHSALQMLCELKAKRTIHMQQQRYNHALLKNTSHSLSLLFLLCSAHNTHTHIYSEWAAHSNSKKDKHKTKVSSIKRKNKKHDCMWAISNGFPCNCIKCILLQTAKQEWITTKKE